jgi:hypothetical protein
VIHVFEHLEGVEDELVACPSLHLADEPDAAGVVLEAGIVQSLGGGVALHCGSSVINRG